jgi:hypothetical protein
VTPVRNGEHRREECKRDEGADRHTNLVRRGEPLRASVGDRYRRATVWIQASLAC